MKTRQRTLLLFFGSMAGLLTLGVSLFHKSEPRFQGRTARQWLRRTYQIDFIHTVPLERALEAIGPSHSVPAIIDELAARPLKSRKSYAYLFNKMPARIQKALPNPVSIVDYRCWVEVFLSRYDAKDLKPVLPDLIRAVQSSDALTRAFATQQLARLGVDATAALPILWKQLDEVPARQPTSYPINTAEAIQKIDPPSARLVPILVEWLANDRMLTYEKVRVFQILGRIGSAAKPAVPLLLKATDTQDELVSTEAADAKWRIEHNVSP